jgi:zona occludens toxin
MSITGMHLITGLIGSGKTLRAVWHIDREIKAGRAVYVCNVNGLNLPGAIPFEDPRQWRDLPPGALLVVDEAQKFWRARRSGEVPPELQDAETSRHDAVSMLILTQQPTYLDKHLRGLVTRHEHLYRRLGAQATTVYRWERCVEDPNAASEKDGADQELFVYPKHLYGAYKSAEQHTVKLRLGTKPKIIMAALALSAGLIAWAFAGIAGDEPPAQGKGAIAVASAPAAAPASSPLHALTDSAYWARLKPRVETAPWSAPLFDNRQASAEPRLFCMSSEAGTGANGEWRPASVSCVTEQGTPYVLGDNAARMIARNGEPYNPFRRPTREPAARRQGEKRTEAGVGAAHGDALTGSVMSAPQIGAYGDLGITPNPTSAPR